MKTAATEDVGPAAKIPTVKKTGGPEKAAPAAKSVQKKALPAKKTAGANSGDAASSWIKPDGTGSAPASHPVKAKLSSRVYHLPGMSAYARTKPDRCYSTAEAAEADGFIRAKR